MCKTVLFHPVLRLCRVCLFVAACILPPSILLADPLTEYEKRELLAANLTSALGQLSEMVTSASVEIPEGLLFLSYTGECYELISAELQYMGGTPKKARFLVTLREGGSADIPEFSHRLVCELNYFLNHSSFGHHRENWHIDEDDNIVMHDHDNFDANCMPNAAQKFWMIDGGITYSGSGVKLNSVVAGYWWKPDYMYPDGRILLARDKALGCSPITTPIEVPGNIYALDFVQSNLPENVWIARRDDSYPERIVLHRAHVDLSFNYSYDDHDSDPSCSQYDYIDAFDDEFIDVDNNPNFEPYEKRMTGIEMIARMQEYSSSECPQEGSAEVDPHPDHAELTLIFTYEDRENNVDEIVCKKVFDAGMTPDENNQDLWNWMNWSNGRIWGEFDIDENGVVYFETTTQCSSTPENPERLGLIKVRNRSVPADQCEMVIIAGGEFCVDELTGQIVYKYNPEGESVTCAPLNPEPLTLSDPVFCFEFCNIVSDPPTYRNVLAASAQSYRDNWSYDPVMHGAWNMGTTYGYRTSAEVKYDPYKGLPQNLFERAERGKWRLDKSYVYRSDIKSGVDNNRIYDNAGVFVKSNGDVVDAFTLFNWSDPGNNVDNWLNPFSATKYAPSGEIMEQHNVVDIYSTSAFAHGGMVSKLTAQNALYESVDFESFEDQDWFNDWDGNGTQEWHPKLVNGIAHSGECSMLLDVDGSGSDPLAKVTLTQQTLSEGLLLKFWLKQEYNVFDINPNFADSPVEIQIGSQIFSELSSDNYSTLEAAKIHKIAQTGEWSLYQLIIKSFNGNLVGDDLNVYFKNKLGAAFNDNVWVDDVRLQPLDASMICFVYDRYSLRVVAQFDDQHFGIFSRYNGEGTIVSTLRETERGKMTMSESQVWMKTQLRPPGNVLTGSIPLTHRLLPSFESVRYKQITEAYDRDGLPQNSDLDIFNMQLDAQGASVNSVDGSILSTSEISSLLDFKSDYPEVDIDKLAILSPDIPYLERLQLVREVIALYKERKVIVEQLKVADTNGTRKQTEAILEQLDRKREDLLRNRLALSDEEIVRLYDDLSAVLKDDEESKDY